MKILFILLVLIVSISSACCDSQEMYSLVLKPELLRDMGYNGYSEVFDLSNLQISSIAPYTFKHFKNAKTIDLSNNILEVISSKALDGLTQLRTLLLNNNKIAEIETNALNDLVSLEDLNLNNNQLTSIDADTFNPMQNIINLDLAYNHIRDMDWDKLRLSNMVYLNAKWNQIKQLSQCDLNATIFTSSCPNLTKITPFADLLSLETLDLSQNEISEINPYDFFFMRSLTFLNMSYNQLKRLNEDIFTQNGALINLQLDHNEIRHVEKHSLDPLVNLQILNLNNNKLVKF